MDQEGNTALAVVPVEQSKALARMSDTPQMSVDDVVARVDLVHEVQRRVMKEGFHYGKIPGVEKPALLKPGAETLGMTFRLDPQFTWVEQWDGAHVRYTVTCTLFHIPTGARVGSGLGSCSTRESKYAWRKGERVCPDCGVAAIIKGKKEYGGGWVCFERKGGCKAKFRDDDEAITGQETGRVANPDIADTYNNVLKMAVKRAHVAAILFATGASELFTQDVEDFASSDPDEERPAARASKPKGTTRKAAPVGESYAALSMAISITESLKSLEALLPRLQGARESKSVSPDEYKSLRAEYGEQIKHLRDRPREGDFDNGDMDSNYPGREPGED